MSLPILTPIIVSFTTQRCMVKPAMTATITPLHVRIADTATMVVDRDTVQNITKLILVITVSAAVLWNNGTVLYVIR